MMCRHVLSKIRYCCGLVLGLAAPALAQSVLQVSNPLFPLTTVSTTATANVTLGIPTGTGVVFNYIRVSNPTGDYTVNNITGCIVDGSTANAAGSLCTVQVNFTPSLPGKAPSVVPITRAVSLQVSDSENGTPQFLSIPLIGSGTAPRAFVVPGIITDLAGNDALSTPGFAGDGGPASGAVFNNPTALAVDTIGNIFILDTGNCLVRRVDKISGNITTFAGVAPSPAPNCGAGQDNVAATTSMLQNPSSIAVDAAGNLYIADSGNSAIRRVDGIAGIITTVAGQLGFPGYSADGTPANTAQLNTPKGVAVDGYGNIYIADSGNYIIREVNVATGAIKTVAGVPEAQGSPYSETFSTPATGFLLGNPQGVTVDSVGNIYIGDTTLSGVMMVTLSTGNITWIFQVPGTVTGFAMDAGDSIHYTLASNCIVGMLPAGSYTPVTLAGSGSCTASGDGGSALAAGFSNPNAVVVDGAGDLYILEADGVRYVDSTGTKPTPLSFGNQQVYATSSPLSLLLFNGDVQGSSTQLGAYFPTSPSSPFALVTAPTATTDCSTATSTTSVLLAPASYCSLAFSFTPVADNPYTQTNGLFEYASGTSTKITQSISLSGTGTGVPATATLTPAMSTITAGIGGGTASQTFTLTNTGTAAPLIVSAVGFANSAVTGFSQSNTCTAAIAHGATCSITVQYAPTTVGSVSQILVVTDNTSATQTTAALTGVGVAPTATLTPAMLNFKAVVSEGSSAEQAFTLTNTSASAYLVVGSIYFNTPNGFNVDNTTSTCVSASLAPVATCTVMVSYNASSTTPATNTLVLQDNTTAGVENATVNGTATAPLGTLSSATVTFTSTPASTQSAAQVITLTNTGTAPLHLSGIVLAGTQPNDFSVNSAACGLLLDPGNYCNIGITFTPVTPGSFSAQLIITDDSGGQPSYAYITQIVSLSGTSPVPVQASSFSIANTGFASTIVSSTTTQPVSLTLNTATKLKSIAMAPYVTEYTVNSVTGCVVDGVTVNAIGTVCTINISFTPSSVGSQHNAQLVVVTVESGIAVPYQFTLTGSSTGTIAALTPGIMNAYIASNGSHGGANPMSGMGGPAVNASVGFFGGFTRDSAGDTFVSDHYFAVIYKVTPDGIINIYAGTPFVTGGYLQTIAGDGGPASSAFLSQPGLLAVDASGNLYVDDSDNFFHYELRTISATTNVITKVLGTGTPCPAATDTFGDGCPAAAVAYTGNNGMAFGPDGNLYFSAGFGIHRYNTQTQTVTLFAGSGGSAGTGGDGGAAIGAAMSPSGIAFDSSGNLIFIDGGVHLRRITAAGNAISTIAGAPGSTVYYGSYDNQPCTNGFAAATHHSSGNGGLAASAVFCWITGLAVDAANNIYTTDFSASEVRRIDSSTSIIVPVSGQNTDLGVDFGDVTEQFGNNDGSARDASLAYPQYMLLDGNANIYIMEYLGNVRKIDVSKSALDYTPYFNQYPGTGRAAVGVGSITGPQQVTVVNAGNTGTVTFNAPFTSSPLFGNLTADYTRDTATADCISTNAALAPGAECPINLDFTPTVAGSPVPGTDTVNDSGGTQSIDLIGYATAFPNQITLTPAILTYVGTVGVATAAQTFTLTNGTASAIGITGITIIGVNPGAFASTNTCGSSVAANSSCTVSVTFTAPSTGNFIAQASVIYTQIYNGTAYPTTLLGGLTGTGGVPEGQFVINQALANSGSFGNQAAGTTSVAHSFSFASTGTAPLLITGLSIIGANANQYAIASSTCPASLAPGTGCIVGVTFSPTANGLQSASLSAADNAADSPQTIALSGTGTGASVAILNITEAIHVTDKPAFILPAILSITEAIHVADAPLPQESALLAVLESVHVTDLDSVLPPAILAILEAIHVTDKPVGTPSLLLAVTEAIHVTDAPAPVIKYLPQTISWAQPSVPVYGDTITLAATASSGLTPVFTVASGPATLIGNALRFNGTTPVIINADQPGNNFYAAAPTVQRTITAVRATPGASLKVSVPLALVTTPVTFTATITSSISVPTGTVTFYDGTASLGSSTLNASGVATFTISTLALGTHSVTAVYAGDSNFNAQSSTPATVQLADFTLTPSTAGNGSLIQTVLPGGVATFVFTLSPDGLPTFPADINLTLSGLPTGATSTLVPQVIPAGSGATTITLQITAPKQLALFRMQDKFLPLAMALLLCPFLPRMRRRTKGLAQTLMLAFAVLSATAGLLALSGCGSSTGLFAQAPRTYNIEVIGTSGTLSHSTTVTLIVE